MFFSIPTPCLGIHFATHIVNHDKNTYFCNLNITNHFQKSMAKTKGNVREKRKIKVKEPDMYRVKMHNDDFTTMDFVVEVLRQVFFKSEAEANALMLSIHKSGYAVVGIYPYDIAVSKVKKTNLMAREHGYPLKVTIEQE